MGDKWIGRGGKNKHLKSTQKMPCDECSQSVDHYPDGTISQHKVYEYKDVNGVKQKTSKWRYCSNKRWRAK